MLGLAFLMISNVRYAAVPTIGYRSIPEILGSLVVIGTLAGLIFLPWTYFFPAAMAYVLWGVVRTVFVGFLDRRHIAEIDDVIGNEDALDRGLHRRRRRRRRGRPGTPASPTSVIREEPKE
jgi:CDP-diacylglycerol--serine O-phosphatidyltransferase